MTTRYARPPYARTHAAMESAAMERATRPTQSQESVMRTARGYDYYRNTDDTRRAADSEVMRIYRRRLATEFSVNDLNHKLAALINGPRPTMDSYDVHPTIRTILDSVGTGSSGGQYLPRVDIEQVIYALFLKVYPFWDRIDKAPANGLKHTWNVKTAIGSAADSTLTLATELTAATEDVSTYAQDQMSNIAVMSTVRGVSLKEIFVVAQSGMQYSPENEELKSGALMMARLAQKLTIQGDQSVSSGAGAATEEGAYNAYGYDGLRLITGGYGTYNAPAVSVVTNADQQTSPGPFSMTQAFNYQTALQMDTGAMPTSLMMSPGAYSKLMNEQEGKQRANDTQELIPGIRVPAVTTTAGILPVMVVPGGANAIGSYARVSDNVTVEDAYVLNEETIHWRYLGSPDVTVIEIPTAVDYKLSRRFLMFLMGGLQVADNGYWQGKVRIPYP